jgi:hypothetical protein
VSSSSSSSVGTKVPTYDEVKNFVESQGMGIDPEWFYEYYTNAGWLDKGGKPIRNWKAKAKGWDKKDRAKSPNTKPNAEEKPYFIRNAIRVDI